MFWIIISELSNIIRVHSERKDMNRYIFLTIVVNIDKYYI